MNFEILEKFEWYNDPENVRFKDEGMEVFAKYNTDFWQCLQRGFKKDNGHFFYCRQNGDFEFVLKWSVSSKDVVGQCGVMVRMDERNWCKASFEKEASGENIITSSLTNMGHSEWSKGANLGNVDEVWFKVVRVLDEYAFYYSVDGVEFFKFKMFYLKSFEDIKVGAYMGCSSEEDFCAVVSDIEIGCLEE
jgi:regulation of enolase protein 1 (concanavalin A-like superfamily)